MRMVWDCIVKHEFEPSFPIHFLLMSLSGALVHLTRFLNLKLPKRLAAS